eukprot:scaffold4335_cov119-Cylindrotheca_fusiformis.AAC.17
MDIDLLFQIPLVFHSGRKAVTKVMSCCSREVMKRVLHDSSIRHTHHIPAPDYRQTHMRLHEPISCPIWRRQEAVLKWPISTCHSTLPV